MKPVISRRTTFNFVQDLVSQSITHNLEATSACFSAEAQSRCHFFVSVVQTAGTRHLVPAFGFASPVRAKPRPSRFGEPIRDDLAVRLANRALRRRTELAASSIAPLLILCLFTQSQTQRHRRCRWNLCFRSSLPHLTPTAFSHLDL